MLTVIIDARTAGDGLPLLLAQLTAGAVNGLVRQVAIVAPPAAPGIDLLCEDMGAEAQAEIAAAAANARAGWLLVIPADFRLRDGWIKALEGHLARGGGAAMVRGLDDGGLFARRPFGVLVERRQVEGLHGADLKSLRRQLGLRADRIG